jgi:SAM-dependent methyltransferase
VIELLQSIDWNQIWKELRARRTTVQKSASSWGERSSAARRMIREDRYVRDFINIMKPGHDWTVLDMGCGPGTLALPLAPFVTHITAADFSQGLLDVLVEECAARGITNVAAKKLAWEDDWQTAGVETYDAVIASRSLVADDLKEAIVKLDTAARKKVFISTIVHDGPFDRRVFEAVGRPLDVGPDYICNYNLLHQMGILASVDFIRQDRRKFESPAEAFESMSWTIDSMTDVERDKLERFVDEHLIQDGDYWITDYQFPVVWAVLWWEKNKA